MQPPCENASKNTCENIYLLPNHYSRKTLEIKTDTIRQVLEAYSSDVLGRGYNRGFENRRI
jgi:hypothetical protein